MDCQGADAEHVRQRLARVSHEAAAAHLLAEGLSHGCSFLELELRDGLSGYALARFVRFVGVFLASVLVGQTFPGPQLPIYGR